MFVPLDKVKCFDISKKSFDILNEKATEGQIRERKYMFTLGSLGLKTMQGQPQKEVSLIRFDFLIMECCSLLTHNKTFFDILRVDHSQTQIY